jgi:hypothetical protein
MSRPPRSRLDDPTAERTADPVPERNQDADDCVRRNAEERDYTPRRYEQPEEADPVMPGADSTLNTKI